MGEQHLGVFAKYWEPGQVKTRLAVSIGKKKAALIYRTFVETTISRLSTLGDQRVLAFTPQEQAVQAKFNSIGGTVWQAVPQSDGDLGNRMREFLTSRLHHGARSAVLVGTDSPNLPLSLVEQSFQKLDEHGVVLGPTEDGGYYLVGISGMVPPIFESIPWSTTDVWQVTINRLEDAGIRYTTLEPWYDVDNAVDLDRLLSDLANLENSDPALRCLEDQLKKILAE